MQVPSLGLASKMVVAKHLVVHNTVHNAYMRDVHRRASVESVRIVSVSVDGGLAAGGVWGAELTDLSPQT